MKMAGRKATVFIINIITFTLLFILILFFYPAGINIVGGLLVIMLMTNGIIFIGGVVMEKWFRTKYLKKDIYDYNKNLE